MTHSFASLDELGDGYGFRKVRRDMGIDALVWIHAMETPAEELFTFKPDELLTLKLATPLSAAPATASTGPQAKG